MLFETQAQEQHACRTLSDACRPVQSPGLSQYLEDLVAATRRVPDNLATTRRGVPAILSIDISEVSDCRKSPRPGKRPVR